MFTRRHTGSSEAAAAAPPTPPTGSPSFTVVARPVHNSIRPPAYTRQQHIDSYLRDRQLAPSTRKVSDDDSTFDTVFQSVTGDTLILRVHWPASASAPGMHSRPPAMTLAGVEARHAWLDGRMRVTGYPPMQSTEAWLEAHVLLGVAVHNIIQHLQLNPPTIVRFVDAGLVAIQTKPAASATKTTASNGIHVRTSNASQSHYNDPPPPAYNDYIMNNDAPEIDLPTIPHSFPEVDSCSRDRLEELMRDDLEFRAFCNRLPITLQYCEMERTVLTENVTTAKKLLQSETELKELHSAVTALHEELQGKINVFQVLEKKQDMIGKPPDVSKVCRDLVKAKKEAFERSERIADTWLESDVCSATTDSFVEEFLVERKVHHTRGAKLEILEGMRRDRLTL